MEGSCFPCRSRKARKGSTLSMKMANGAIARRAISNRHPTICSLSPLHYHSHCVWWHKATHRSQASSGFPTTQAAFLINENVVWCFGAHLCISLCVAQKPATMVAHNSQVVALSQVDGSAITWAASQRTLSGQSLSMCVLTHLTGQQLR